MATGSEELVQYLMHADPVSATTGASLREIVESMSDSEVGSVLILDLRRVVGIVTQRDIVIALANGEDLNTTSR